ncbi:MAG: phosphodiesterase [Shimia sp.]|uniref:glycerophosphodiester phosphodiesterase family protein n=1 Tax=Shimia sp. TaxID=1954381 RepID=UPI003B8CF73A
MLDKRFLDAPIAHRALHDVNDGRPENSRAAIEAAIAQGFGIEIDLQLSLDGVAMAFHDYQLQRLAKAKGAVRQHTAAALGAISLIGGEEGIPTFAEVLDLVAGRVPLLIEFKDQDGIMGPNVGDLEASATQAVQGYDGPLAFMAFNPHSVAVLRDLAPEVPRGLTTDPFHADGWPLLPETVRTRLKSIPDYDAVGACFISHSVDDLQSPEVARIKAQGASVLCWTVTSGEQEQEARSIVDNVTFEGYVPKGG